MSHWFSLHTGTPGLVSSAKSLLRLCVVADPNLLWGGLLKMLDANMPEEVHVWLSNLKQTVAPLLERALEMLRAIP